MTIFVLIYCCTLVFAIFFLIYKEFKLRQKKDRLAANLAGGSMLIGSASNLYKDIGFTSPGSHLLGSLGLIFFTSSAAGFICMAIYMAKPRK